LLGGSTWTSFTQKNIRFPFVSDSEVYFEKWGEPLIFPGQFDDTWLLHRVMRLRTILRYVKDPKVETGLRELIAEAEKRLEQLEAGQRAKEPS